MSEFRLVEGSGCHVVGAPTRVDKRCSRTGSDYRPRGTHHLRPFRMQTLQSSGAQIHLVDSQRECWVS